MNYSLKIFLIAFYIVTIGFIAAHNAKWIRDGISPWWSAYIISFFTSTIYAYLAKNPIFPLTYTSAFQTFFFHGSWYLTTIFVIGDSLGRFQSIGIIFMLVGMIFMSLK